MRAIETKCLRVLKLLLDKFRLQLFDTFDEFAFLRAALAVLAPVVQDLLQFLNAHLL